MTVVRIRNVIKRSYLGIKGERMNKEKILNENNNKKIRRGKWKIWWIVEL